MTEIERIQNDLDKGYTVNRYGTTKALHKQMLNDIKYLNDLAKHNEVLGDVSYCDCKEKTEISITKEGNVFCIKCYRRKV